MPAHKMDHRVALGAREFELLAHFFGYGLAHLLVPVCMAAPLLVKGQAMGLANIVQQQRKANRGIHVIWGSSKRVQGMLPHVVSVKAIMLVKLEFGLKPTLERGVFGGDGRGRWLARRDQSARQ